MLWIEKNIIGVKHSQIVLRNRQMVLRKFKTKASHMLCFAPMSYFPNCQCPLAIHSPLNFIEVTIL